MKYSKTLIKLRNEKNLQQKQISEVLGVRKEVYGHYEREETLISLTNINILSNYYNVSIDYIFEFTNNRQYNNSKKEIDKVLVGDKLKEFRKENKMTQAKLASFLNTTQSTVSAYEKGTTLILASFLYAICKKYNISADYLLGKIDSPKYLKK